MRRISDREIFRWLSSVITGSCRMPEGGRQTDRKEGAEYECYRGGGIRTGAFGRKRNLVHLPGDLKYYKEKTIGNHIIVGGRHWNPSREASLLPDLENIVC